MNLLGVAIFLSPSVVTCPFGHLPFWAGRAREMMSLDTGARDVGALLAPISPLNDGAAARPCSSSVDGARVAPARAVVAYDGDGDATSLAAAASRANGPSPVASYPPPPSPCLAGAEALPPVEGHARAERVGHRFPPHSSESILLAAAIAVALLLLAVVAASNHITEREQSRPARAQAWSPRGSERASLSCSWRFKMTPVSSRMIPWENHADRLPTGL